VHVQNIMDRTSNDQMFLFCKHPTEHMSARVDKCVLCQFQGWLKCEGRISVPWYFENLTWIELVCVCL